MKSQRTLVLFFMFREKPDLQHILKRRMKWTSILHIVMMKILIWMMILIFE